MSVPPALIRFVPLAFVLLWSTGFIGARYGLPYIEPFNLLLIRMLLTLGVFLAFIFIFRARWPSPSQAMHQLVAGALVHGCYLGGVFAAIKWQLPAGVTSILVGLQPVLTAVLAWMMTGQTLRRPQWGGLLLGLLGVVLVLGSGLQPGNFEVRIEAILAAMVALVGISVGTLYQKRFGAGTDLLTGSFFQYLSTALAPGAYWCPAVAGVWSVGQCHSAADVDDPRGRSGTCGQLLLSGAARNGTGSLVAVR
jgi:drug/metabolite transporter (DMT)-like permease